MRRSREDTDLFVHQAESPEQMKRRYRKSVLKPLFREKAAEIATGIFGKKSPIVDIIKEEENCTKKICDGLVKLTGGRSPDFNDAVEIFFNSVELESGPLDNGTVIRNAVVSFHHSLKGKALAAAVEILLATEDEKLVLDFLAKAKDAEPEKSRLMLQSLLLMSEIENIHTMVACVKGYIENPEKASEQIENIGSKIGARYSTPGENSMLFSDKVLADVVAENLGLD